MFKFNTKSTVLLYFREVQYVVLSNIATMSINQKVRIGHDFNIRNIWTPEKLLYRMTSRLRV